MAYHLVHRRRIRWQIALLASLSLLDSVLVLAAGHGDRSWEAYCGGENGEITAFGGEKPQPNYKHPLVNAAAEKLHRVEDIERRGRQGDIVFNDGRQIYQTKYAKDGGYISAAFWIYPAFEQAYDVCAKQRKNECDGPYPYSQNVLTITCGEYRDNLRMLEKKLEWYASIEIPTEKVQTYDKHKTVWQQITSSGYRDLLELSAALYRFRFDQMLKKGENPPNLCAVNYSRLKENSVPATTVCEYRYIFSEYLAKQKTIGSIADFDAYQAGLAAWTENPDNCDAADHDFYYEFHADGALKAHSLESNGMIWSALDYAQGCEYQPDARAFKARTSTRSITDAACAAYYKSPYESRRSLNQQGLMRLMFNPRTAQGLDIDAIMSHHGSMTVDTYGTEPDADLVFITEDLTGDGFAEMVVLDPAKKASCTEPGNTDEHSENGVCRMLWARQNQDNAQVVALGLLAADKTIESACGASRSVLSSAQCGVYRAAVEKAKATLGSIDTSGLHLITEVHPDWKPAYGDRKDKGLSRVFKTPETVWNRLKTVFDRHTQWYMIDLLNLQTSYHQPVYSPWMASSYYIDKSAPFASPGYAMGKQLDPGRLQWMFVEKVAVDRWFRAEDLRRAWPPADELDLLNTWFDETTFSQSELGASERGWDRFAMAEPAEMEAIFWLYETTPPKGFQAIMPPGAVCTSGDDNDPKKRKSTSR